MSKWYQGTWNTENKNAWNEDWQEEPEEEYEGSAQMEDWLDDKDAGTRSTAILLAQIEHYYGKFQGNGSGLTGLKVPQELPAKSQASGQYTKENWTWQPKEIEREEGKFEGAAWAAHNLCEDNSYQCYTCGTKFPTASCLANMEGPDFKTFHKRATASDTLDQWTCRLNAEEAPCAAAWARLPMWIAQQVEKQFVRKSMSTDSPMIRNLNMSQFVSTKRTSGSSRKQNQTLQLDHHRLTCLHRCHNRKHRRKTTLQHVPR